MIDLDTSSSVWLTSFWGFSPEEEGVVGFTEKADRSRFMSLIDERQLVCIYGASSPETAPRLRNQLLGLLEVERTPIDSFTKMSEAAKESSVKLGRDRKWRYAVPARRAWRTTHGLNVSQIFHESYDPKNGRNISKFGKFLVPREARWLLERVPFTEVQVYGEPKLILNENIKPIFMSEILKPSKGIFGSFGERSFVVEDKPHVLYLVQLSIGTDLVAGRQVPYRCGLFKIGISNNTDVRIKTINLSFPEGSKIKWELKRTAKFSSREPAAKAESDFKSLSISDYGATSLGREFFIMDKTKVDQLFNKLSPPTGLVIGVRGYKE